MKKLTASELLRRACISAEQNEMDFAECNKEDPEVYAATMDFVRQLRAYRLKRWGKGKFEKLFEMAKAVPIGEILSGPNRPCKDPEAT